MPQTKQAEKYLRQTKKRAARNLVVRREIKTLLKKTRVAIAAKSEQAGELIRQTIKKLDRAAQKKIIKKNTASRLKSRLQHRFQQIAITK